MRDSAPKVKVAVVGAGKMGLPLACQIASRGAQVTSCDRSQAVVDAINAGRMPFDEPGVGKLLTATHQAGSLTAVTDVREGVRGCDAVIVIIPVLLRPDKTADLSVIGTVTRQIASSLVPGMMISYETTLPVGTTRNYLRPILELSGLKAGVDFDLVFSPERVKSQLVMKHLANVPKIVGGINAASTHRGEEFYQKYIGASVINVETLENAEFAKIGGMIYRDVNIALANELAGYAEQAGVDFPAARMAANTDGDTFLLSPGIGVGGHCTPVYPYFVLADARAKNIPMPLTADARHVNDAQAGRALARVQDAGADLRRDRILILGLGFRPQVKEHTLSPAFQIRDEAVNLGAEVYLHDPLYSPEEINRHGFRYWDMTAQHWPEIVILNTAHPHYMDANFEDWRERGVRYVVDGRNVWDPQRVAAAGHHYFGAGIASVNTPAGEPAVSS